MCFVLSENKRVLYYLRTNSDLCHLQHKLIGFYNRDEKCLQRGTDWVFKYSSLRFVFKWSIFMCFVFIWEQTATCATYNINWLVFIAEMKSVYCAVPTGSLNKAVCASSSMCYAVQRGVNQTRKARCITARHWRIPVIPSFKCWRL